MKIYKYVNLCVYIYTESMCVYIYIYTYMHNILYYPSSPILIIHAPKYVSLSRRLPISGAADGYHGALLLWSLGSASSSVRYVFRILNVGFLSRSVC